MVGRSFIWPLGVAFILGGSVSTTSAGSFSRDVANLKNVAGCFEVTYRFAEDGNHDIFSERYGLEQPVKEWVGFKQNESGVFTLPHVSITGDSRAVPHWYEVWKYHPNEETWTQEVWSQFPDNNARKLRYQCTAPWQKNRWECHAGKAPKPFRDVGAPFGFDRTDYEWLDRKNILLVTENGWLQNQHNKKMKLSETVVAYELGWITYQRLEDKECKTAIDQFSDF